MSPKDRLLLRQLMPPEQSLSIERYPALVDPDTAQALEVIAAELFANRFNTAECHDAYSSLEQWAGLLGVPHAYQWLLDRRREDPEFLMGVHPQDLIAAYLEYYPGLKARTNTGRPPVGGRGITPTFITYAVFGLALRLGLEQLQKNLSQGLSDAKKVSSKVANASFNKDTRAEQLSAS